ncbi:MAG: antimicrobial peptide ABC transporter permease [Bacteroidetes bacterium OLB12]|nr:MAG: antimicrobial peptide ABC transporter permease [Bacteroidetes bacterium OLB12]
MLKNYLKIAFRALWRSKIHSSINVLGLSLGIACCVLIALFVKDEVTFDTFHAKANRIYRVFVKEDWGENQQFFNTTTPMPMGPALKDNLPEVESFVRLVPINTMVKNGEKQFSEGVVVADRSAFSVFDFEWIKGERAVALRDPHNLVITKHTAEKYFGPADPIGQSLSIQVGENFEEFTVTGVASVPTNSSIRFNLVIPDHNYSKLFSERQLNSGWFNIHPSTYVLLREGSTAAQAESKFPDLFRRLLGEEDFKQSKYAPGLQPLTSIHLDTSYPTGDAPVSDVKYSYILGAIAVLILVVACINFVTLSVGRSLKRAREVGIRKVVGAQRRQLVAQFIGEAILITTVALVVGVMLSVLGLPLFNQLSGKQLIFSWNGFLLIVAASLLLIIGLMAGSYPAFVLSSFKPIAVLKGSLQTGSTKQRMRQILVGVQLVLSIFLVSSTLIMQQQLNFLRNKNLGFNKEQVAVIQLNVPRVGRMGERVNKGFEMAEQFKTELGKVSGVVATCASSHDFGNGGWTAVGFTDEQGTYRNFNMNVVDDEYIPLMKMELVAGRNFTDAVADRKGVIVNEAFAKEYGWTDVTGKRIPGKGFGDHEVIGIVKDFNYTSLYTSVPPLVLVQDPVLILAGSENINFENSPMPKLFVRLAPDNMQATLDQVKGVWDKLTAAEEFDFTFVDQALDAQYKSDQNLGKIVSLATLLAVLIGSLGLYALASLAMQNRTKEISIRKVMGATEQSLLVLLSRDYVLMILISLVLSVPVTWYLMTSWLQNFQYRIEVGWQVFALAGGLSLVVAMLTISYQALKTAWTRPAETLKYE